MTNISEIEIEYEKYRGKIEAKYPRVAQLLNDFNGKDAFFKKVNEPESHSLRKELYTLFGYPKELNKEDENFSDLALSFIRFKDYPLSDVMASKSEAIFREYCFNEAVKNIQAKDLFSSLSLQIKYLQDISDKDKKVIEHILLQKGEAFAVSDIRFISMLKDAYKSKNPEKVLSEFEKGIKYTSIDTPDAYKVWKRARYFVNSFCNSKVETFNEVLINTIPNMKFVSAGEVFKNKEKDEQALADFNKLVALLPYKDEKDKLDVLNGINNYMDKDIVKMLPQFKDKWVNGRLCFEIGDEEKALFKKYKGVMNTKYFVITVNPVDLLFCSTDQEYQSCFSLLSTHGSVKGLPNFIARKDVAMCFLSSGSLSKPWKHEWYPGLSFSHIKIKARAFLYNDKDLKYIDVGRCYSPSEISNATEGSLFEFRTSARILLWKLLTENGVDMTQLGSINRKCLKQYLTNGYTDSQSLDIEFDVTPLVEKRFKGHGHNEVYFDNLKFAFIKDGDSEDVSKYCGSVGAGCLYKFNASGSLGELYRRGLENAKR